MNIAIMVSLLSIIIILIFILIKIHNKYKFVASNMIKTLQEIAVDYHVRIISNGYGNILCENEEWLECKGPIDQISGCMEFGTENQERWIRGFEYSKGKFYLIYFRMLGKYYLAYSDNDLVTWINVVRKARKENKRFFSKSNIYDRNKI